MTSIIAGSGDAPRYPSVSIGVHKARCVKIIDLGTQKSDFDGNVTWKRQVLIIFETPEEHNSEGCLLYTSPSPRDGLLSRMPSSA